MAGVPEARRTQSAALSLERSEEPRPGGFMGIGSVASAAAAPDVLAAGRALLAEVDVLVDSLHVGVRNEAHLLLGEEIAIPGMNGGAPARHGGEEQERRRAAHH